METITAPFTLGDARVAGPLGVFPVFGPEPKLDYRSFADATGLGAFVKELDEGASVNDLLVENPTDKPLLIFEGEEVLGAKQNRVFDVSVLVGRWRAAQPVRQLRRARSLGPGREAEHFSVSPTASDPSLRRLKRARANDRAAAGLAGSPRPGRGVGRGALAARSSRRRLRRARLCTTCTRGGAVTWTRSCAPYDRWTARSARSCWLAGARLRSTALVVLRCSLRCCRGSPRAMPSMRSTARTAEPDADAASRVSRERDGCRSRAGCPPPGSAAASRCTTRGSRAAASSRETSSFSCRPFRTTRLAAGATGHAGIAGRHAGGIALHSRG